MRWPRRKRKRPLDELSDRILAAVPMSTRELRARIQDPSHDTSRLSFASGLALGLVVGIIVAVAFLLRPGAGEEDVRDTELELRSVADESPAG